MKHQIIKLLTLALVLVLFTASLASCGEISNFLDSQDSAESGDKLENNDPSVNGQLLEDLFQRYLWKATRTFSVRNGLPVLNKLELEFKLIVLKNGNKEF